MDLPSSLVSIVRQDIMPCWRNFKAALGAWIYPTDADIQEVWNDYVIDHPILNISPNLPGRLLLNNIVVLVSLHVVLHSHYETNPLLAN
jgi:hypothetical protein